MTSNKQSEKDIINYFKGKDIKKADKLLKDTAFNNYKAGYNNAISDCIKEIEALRNSNEGCYGGISNCEYGCIDVILDKFKAKLQAMQEKR